MPDPFVEKGYTLPEKTLFIPCAHHGGWYVQELQRAHWKGLRRRLGDVPVIDRPGCECCIVLADPLEPSIADAADLTMDDPMGDTFDAVVAALATLGAGT